MRDKAIKISSFLSILMIWYIIYLIIDHPLLMPSILDVGKAFIKMFQSNDVLIAFSHSLFRLIVSLGVSSGLGIMLGFLSAKHEVVQLWIKPYITIIKTIPVISAIIILYVVFGFQIAPYVITFLMIFPLFYQATYQGVKQTSKDMMDVYHLESDDWYLCLRWVYLPNIKDYLMLAAYQSFGLGLKVLVTSEFITQTRTSVGKILYDAKVYLNYDMVFAITIALIGITLIIEWFAEKYKKQIGDE